MIGDIIAYTLATVCIVAGFVWMIVNHDNKVPPMGVSNAQGTDDRMNIHDHYKIKAYWEDIEQWFIIDYECTEKKARKQFEVAIAALPHLRIKLFKPTNSGATEREVDSYEPGHEGR